MSNRSERREADRLARKLAYKQRFNQPSQTQQAQDQFQTQLETIDEPITEPRPISEAQLAANRANAQFSTGATSSEGKAKSAMNSLKHGLTSKTVLLPNEDPADYQELTHIYLEMHSPGTAEESRLVQSIIDTDWRLLRITRLESALLYKGQLECTKQNEERQGVEREHFVMAEGFLKYEKSLRNLQIQETRLRRLKDKDQAELVRLQTVRKRDERLAIEAQLKAQKQSNSRPNQPQPRTQAANGFVFETQNTTTTAAPESRAAHSDSQHS